MHTVALACVLVHGIQRNLLEIWTAPQVGPFPQHILPSGHLHVPLLRADSLEQAVLNGCCKRSKLMLLCQKAR